VACQRCQEPLPRASGPGRPRLYCASCYCSLKRSARRNRKTCNCGRLHSAKTVCRLCARKEREANPLLCACGKPRTVGTKRCFRCDREARRRRLRTCRYCKVSFRPKTPERISFCRREHYFAYKHERSKPQKPRRPDRSCEQCGVFHRRKKFCSPACSKEYRRVHRTHRSFICAECGQVQVRGDNDKRQKLCGSVECKRQRLLKTRLFPGWYPEAIPAELLQARFLQGQVIWLLSDRPRYERYYERNPNLPGSPQILKSGGRPECL
jgi:hypothetical protein